MEKYWLAVLVLVALTLSSANGAAFVAPGEELQGMFNNTFTSLLLYFQEFALHPVLTQEVRERTL